MRIILYESFSLVADRRADFKARALARLAHNQNFSLVPRDATKSTSSLKSERFLKDPGSSFRRHATASVNDPEATTLNFGAHSNFHHTTVRHCIDGVENCPLEAGAEEVVNSEIGRPEDLSHRNSSGVSLWRNTPEFCGLITLFLELESSS